MHLNICPHIFWPITLYTHLKGSFLGQHCSQPFAVKVPLNPALPAFWICWGLISWSVFAEGEAEAVVKAELGEETGLVEDLVAVSYMGDELDLETVGDIIAIIEEKVHTV